MATKVSKLLPIDVLPGCSPGTDTTSFSTPHYTFMDKIRPFRGRVYKIGGWRNFAFKTGQFIQGTARSIYNDVLNNSIKELIGTNQKLYYLSGQSLNNITPLDIAGVAIPNSLATDYGLLGSNPISVTNGSNIVTITDANAILYAVNDIVVLSGATATGGVPAGEINATSVIRSVSSGSFTIRTATSATSTATGGGASVNRSTGRLRITKTAHGQLNGDRVKIDLATATGGISNLLINREFIIRNVVANSFDVFTSGIATSSVSAGGGAATVYYTEIADGNLNVSAGQGYGMGFYGAGTYGTSKISSMGIAYPRIWFFDRFADTTILTPGNQGSLYQWSGTSDVAPFRVPNAPTSINYSFVSDGIVVTLGAGGIPNRIFASDQNDPTQWTASSTNQVFDDDIEGAGRFVSHVPAAGENLLFTSTQTYRFTYIDQPLIWSTKLLDNSIGIIAPMARVSVNNVAYWMGIDNFYRWRGGNVEIIPSSTELQSTILNYVFKNINTTQAYKSFAWYNRKYNEIWFHYPSADSNECNRVARVNLSDNTWSPDTFDRTAAEYPNNLFGNPRMISLANSLYVHEFGNDADGVPMRWTMTSNLRGTRGGDKKTMLISGFVPDSIVNGNVSVQVSTYLFPQSTEKMFDKTYFITPETGELPIQVGGRYWQYTWSGESLGQDFIFGSWFEMAQESAEQ